MRFSKEDLKPNVPIPLDAVRAGSTSDARWRDVPETIETISTIVARRDYSRQVREAGR